MSTHRPFERSGGLGFVFKNITKALKSNSDKNVPVQINPTVVGGGEDQQKLFHNLRNGTVSQRAFAAEKMAEALKKFSISSIPEVWYSARDLCDIGIQSSDRRSALNLLIECVRHLDDDSGDRVMFFKDIMFFCKLNGKITDPDYKYFLGALKILTSNGFNSHDFGLLDSYNGLEVFLLSGLKSLSKDLRQNMDTSSEDFNTSSTLQSMIETIDLTTNCLRANYDVLDSSVASSLIKEVCTIGLRNDIRDTSLKVLELIRAVTALGEFPLDSYQPMVDVLCLLYNDSYFKEKSWNIISSIQLVGYHDKAVMCLCSIIQDTTLQRYINGGQINSNVKIKLGAISLLERILVIHTFQERASMDVLLFPMLKAMLASVSLNIGLINSAHLRSFDRIFSKQAYDINFGISITEPFDKIMPFHLWYSHTLSLFDVLSAIRIDSAQDITYMRSICLNLVTLYENHELPSPKDKLIEFLLTHYSILTRDTSLFVLRYFNDENLCAELNPLWKENSFRMLNAFYFEHNDPIVREESLKVIKQAFNVSQALFDRRSLSYDIIFAIYGKSGNEQDENVINYLMNHILLEILLMSPLDMSDELMKSISYQYFQVTGSSERSVMSSSASQTSSKNSITYSENYLTSFSEVLCTAFLISTTEDIQKAYKVYSVLIDLSTFSLRCKLVRPLLVISKALIRLRVTQEGFVYLTKSLDMTGLATAFKRNTLESDFVDLNYLWKYPEVLNFLPEKYFDKPLKTVISDTSSKTDFLDIGEWFKVVITVMEDFVGWEIYSFIWAHFCEQLSNMALFEGGQEDKITKLRTLICDALTLNLPTQISLPENITKADLQVVAARTLSALIGYRDYFTKQEQDQLVTSLIVGLGSWERTAIPCISSLTVCCCEIPLSIKKYLSVILTKLQTTITSVFAAPLTLEFLLSLIYLPALTTNFTPDEFKRVFGIAFKYIQYSNDMKRRTSKENAEKNFLQEHGKDALVERSASTKNIEITTNLSYYLLTLSYGILSSWFLTVNLPERKQLASFLVRNLISADGNNSEDRLDEQTIAFLDLITRFTYSDMPLVITNPSAEKKTSEYIHESKFILGNSIMTIETDTRFGTYCIRIRRPTGTTVLNGSIEVSTSGKNIKTSSDSRSAPSATSLNSNYILLQLFNNIDSKRSVKPLPLLEDAITSRALLMIDRTPTVEFHKIGIVYIGPGQQSEKEILSNRVGSPAYQTFLHGIGDLLRLKHCKEYYVGGLDTENDTDGEFTVLWSSKTTHVVFHVTTMMAHHETDRNFDLKKRHIGNNYVNIYFDESSKPFNFNIIKSQFNFLSIVITPVTIASTARAGGRTLTGNGLNESPSHFNFFKVKTYRRAGVPAVFATSHFKVISEENLPSFIRGLSILAHQFANAWHASVSNPYLTNWSHRARQINILKEKTLAGHKSLQEESLRTTATSSSTMFSFLSQVSPESAVDPNSAAVSTSDKYEYLATDENEAFSNLEFTSYT